MVDSEQESDFSSDEVMQIAHRIESYLSDRVGAANTLEGIVHWWLMQQKMLEQEDFVKQAILYLHEQGKVEKKSLPDGTDLFYCKK